MPYFKWFLKLFRDLALFHWGVNGNISIWVGDVGKSSDYIINISLYKIETIGTYNIKILINIKGNFRNSIFKI